MRFNYRFCYLLLFTALMLLGYTIFFPKTVVRPVPMLSPPTLYNFPEDFEGFDNVSGTADGRYIVPNYVHFLRLGQPNFTFVETVCVLAALKHQRPERLYIHTDVLSFSGKYWDVLVSQSEFRKAVVLKYVEVPVGIFGKALNRKWRKFHGGDLLRLRVLMEYGGIFLDNDSYVVRSLDNLRRYEMTIGWREGGNISNQVIIAHKNARFLRLWLDTYKDYRHNQWYYNAGIKPTQEVLLKNPGLVHRMKGLLAAVGLLNKIFSGTWAGWRTHYAIHLLIRHQYLLKNVTGVATYPVVFDELNIRNYPITFREMVYDVYPMNLGVNNRETVATVKW